MGSFCRMNTFTVRDSGTSPSAFRVETQLLQHDDVFDYDSLPYLLSLFLW